KNAKDKDSSKEPFQIFENHIFQEYTYKKITPCDICSQILRGHTRQGLRCRMCKMNVHPDCQEKVGKCQPKTRLLRRQRSTSELETRLSQLADTQQDPEEALGATAPAMTATSKGNSPGKQGDDLDQTYQVLKEANVLKKPGGGSSGSGSGNGLHGSSQTLHSQHEMTPGRLMGRSNPSVNVIPGTTGSSGHNTPSGPGQKMSVAAAPSSGKLTWLE
ncbi:SH3 and cysteine-rich domain-containing protein 2, partial [Orchesella cincta]